MSPSHGSERIPVGREIMRQWVHGDGWPSCSCDSYCIYPEISSFLPSAWTTLFSPILMCKAE